MVPEDSVGHELFVIIEGEAQIQKDGVVLAVMSAGEHFGMPGLLGRTDRKRNRGGLQLIQLLGRLSDRLDHFYI